MNSFARRIGSNIPAQAPLAPLKATTALRREIFSPALSFLMEAHNGLSAKLAEEAGFRGVWASGLSISASLGLRDSNEASWTQVLEILEYMVDATDLPILVDGDTGHGNFNNVRRFVRKLGERGVGGVCIEDKLFPKANSFIGEAQPLADIEEFCGRLKAGKDSQVDDDFIIVARTEALISGWPMDEALKRAEAYHAAGADAILIHSKKPDAEQIFEFRRRWGDRAPVVIVPTTYHSTPTELFRQAGVSTVIWANHMLRASITAMREIARRIHQDESLRDVEGRVAGVKDVFRLVGNDELEAAEARYLPAPQRQRAVVLAASRGELGELTKDRPKCMIDVRGQPLLQRLVSTLTESGVRETVVVRGYRKDAVSAWGAKLVDNDRYGETGEVYSLGMASTSLSGELVLAYGDVLFRRYILDSLLASGADIVLAVDARPWTPGSAAGPRDLVAADHRFSGDYLDDQPAHLVSMAAADIPSPQTAGEWMGLARLSSRGSEWLVEEIEALKAEGLYETADLPTLFTRLAARHPVRIKYFTGHWMDVDTLADLADARNFT
ncbi:MAG TPA: phosphoenolpyruvate mutase [Caulobacteraceae bacterium]|jgi:phosphoenolpyruvate phosphomutase|nr:phosphoenolpyruvate mutase [Caulobacteraceae bacterium]